MVSGAEKRKRKRAAAATAIATTPQEPTEWRHMSYNGRDLDIPFRTFAEGTPAALPTDTEVYRTRDRIVELGVRTMVEDSAGDLRKDWEVAKARLGVAKAGESLEKFVRLNSKLIPLDPWDHRPGQSPIFATGTTDPLTMDSMVIFSGLASTTKAARLIEPHLNGVRYAQQNTHVLKKGEWVVWGMPPTPGEGLKLESWEKVFGLTARYTSPFSR